MIRSQYLPFDFQGLAVQGQGFVVTTGIAHQPTQVVEAAGRDAMLAQMFQRHVRRFLEQGFGFAVTPLLLEIQTQGPDALDEIGMSRLQARLADGQRLGE